MADQMQTMTPMDEARSPANATDALMMGKSGRMSPDMTFGQFMEQQYGVAWDMPVTEAGQKIMDNMKNATMPGKMETLAQKGAAPEGAPSPQGGGLADLMGQLGG